MKLKNTLDPSDARAVEFLNKFRCNEILEEQHVCCQNEPVQSENEDGRFRTSRQPNFHHEPMRSDHDLNSDSNYHNYHDDYHSHHKKDSSSAEDMGWDMSRTPLEFGYNKDNRWKESNHIPHRQFDSSYGGNNHRAHHHQKDPEGGFHFLYNSERNGGDSKHYITHDGAYDHITEATTYKRTTSRNRSTTRNHRTTPNNRTQKRKTDEQTTPSTRRTTSNYDSTTTKSTDINRNIGEGDIIFEDTFEDLLERKSRFTTEGTTRSNSQSNKSCETPDGKSGI